MSSPSATDWISAISSAVLGGLAVFITIWQWTASGFRPHLSVRIEKPRTAIELRIRNKGRATGIVERVVVVKPRARPQPAGSGHRRRLRLPWPRDRGLLVGVNARFDSFPDGKFQALALLGLTQMKIIIEALDNEPFPENVKVKVELGRSKPKYKAPDMVSDVSLRGLKSVLPPSAFKS
jgi:hypothetical protein